MTIQGEAEDSLDYQAMFDAYPDAVFILSQTAHITHANSAAVQRYATAIALMN